MLLKSTRLLFFLQQHHERQIEDGHRILSFCKTKALHTMEKNKWSRTVDQRHSRKITYVFFSFILTFYLILQITHYTVMLVTYIKKFFYLIKWSLFSTCLLFFVSRVVTDVNSPQGKIISLVRRVAQQGLDFTLNNVTVGHRPRQVYWLLSSNVNITYPL